MVITESQVGVHDLVLLDELTEEKIVDNLRKRWDQFHFFFFFFLIKYCPSQYSEPLVLRTDSKRMWFTRTSVKCVSLWIPIGKWTFTGRTMLTSTKVSWFFFQMHYQSLSYQLCRSFVDASIELYIKLVYFSFKNYSEVYWVWLNISHLKLIRILLRGSFENSIFVCLPCISYFSKLIYCNCHSISCFLIRLKLYQSNT